MEKWLKKEGEHFNAGETICEVTIDGVTLGIDQEQPGIVAEILVAEDSNVHVGKSLAIIVEGDEDYAAFVAKFKSLDDETDAIGHGSEADDASDDTVTADTDNMTSSLALIKTVKQLIKTDAINSEDDFAHDLLTLCRNSHRNKELLEAFDASFDGDDFNEETFEASFFIDNARTIVGKLNVEEDK